MRLEDLNWFDVDQYLTNDDRLMLVLGSCEQHAYLSLLSDVKIPMALADAASKQTNVLVLPAVNFGVSPYFMDYPGTFSLRISTLMDLVEDLIRSAVSHGFKNILVLNGHGGNNPVRARLYELANEYPDILIRWYAWWQSHSVEAVLKQYGLKSSHASFVEAFPFTIVSDLPEDEKAPPYISGLLGSKRAREIYKDGSFGGPYKVNQKIMDEIFSTALADIMEMLDFGTR